MVANILGMLSGELAPKKDLSKVKRNVSKMISMNAPEKEIDDYISSEGSTVDEVKNFYQSPEATKPIGETLGSFVKPVMESAKKAYLPSSEIGNIGAVPGMAGYKAQEGVGERIAETGVPVMKQIPVLKDIPFGARMAGDPNAIMGLLAGGATGEGRQVVGKIAETATSPIVSPVIKAVKGTRKLAHNIKYGTPTDIRAGRIIEKLEKGAEPTLSRTSKLKEGITSAMDEQNLMRRNLISREKTDLESGISKLQDEVTKLPEPSASPELHRLSQEIAQKAKQDALNMKKAQNALYSKDIEAVGNVNAADIADLGNIAVDRIATKYGAETPNAKAAIKKVQDLMDGLQNSLDDNGEIAFSKVKSALDDLSKSNFQQNSPEFYALKGALEEALPAKFPKYAEVNAKHGPLIDALDDIYSKLDPYGRYTTTKGGKFLKDVTEGKDVGGEQVLKLLTEGTPELKGAGDITAPIRSKAQELALAKKSAEEGISGRMKGVSETSLQNQARIEAERVARELALKKRYSNVSKVESATNEALAKAKETISKQVKRVAELGWRKKIGTGVKTGMGLTAGAFAPYILHRAVANTIFRPKGNR